jgi:hypothetical protein
VPLANELVRIDAAAAWNVIRWQFEKALPQWRADLFSWLKGGLNSHNEKGCKGAIADLPILEIIQWIEQDAEGRAGLIAHVAPGTLDDEYGGQLTRELLTRYGGFDGVYSGIGATFHTGSWSGSTSAYLKRKREKLRRWLASGYSHEVTRWIETEIEYLDRSIEREEIDEERSSFD